MKNGPVKFRVIRNLDYFLHSKNHDQEIQNCTVYDWNFHEFGDLHKLIQNSEIILLIVKDPNFCVLNQMFFLI